MYKVYKQGALILDNVLPMTTVFDRQKGLMFSMKMKNLIFVFPVPRRVEVHMLFVFHKIDVIFLNAKGAVVELKEQFYPFTAYFAKKKCKYMIECKAGTVKHHKIKIGDVLTFSE